MIREAAETEILMVTDLALLLWPDHDYHDLREEFEGILADENAVIAVWLEHNDVVGFAQCQLRFDYVEGTGSSPVGYLEGIFVAENYRMQGIAKKLLGYCEAWTKERGCSEFASDCELTNSGSLRFHLKAGFTESNRIICFHKRL